MNISRNPTSRPRGGFAALSSALAAALQWRLLVCWLIALAVPTAIAALPMWTGLSAQFKQSTAADALARGKNVSLLFDGMFAMRDSAGAISAGAFVATALTVLLSPWLSGMVVASIRAGRRLRMGELVHGGLAEYGRMLRMLLWAIVPLGLAFAVGGGLSGALDKATADAILASDAARAADIGLGVLVVLAVFAHLTLEAGRGWLGADPSARSVLRAWGKGALLVLRRPLASLIVYLGIAVVCYGLALVVAWLRLRTGSPGVGSVLLGLLLTQLIVATIAWARIARLYAFADLAHDAIARRATSTPVADARGAEAGEPPHLPPAMHVAPAAV